MCFSGRYVTEAEVEHRVNEMEKTREAMLERLEYTAQQQLKQKNQVQQSAANKTD